MAIEYKANAAVFAQEVGVDDADALLEWLRSNTTGVVDLSACTHLHPANLQILMAAAPRVTAWPRDAGLDTWLRSALVAPRSL